MDIARKATGDEGSDQDVWTRAVIQSIRGKAGTLIRKTKGVAFSATAMEPGDVADNLRVSPHWDDADYKMYEAEFGDRTPRVLYSAMFKTPLPGTEADVATHFGDSAQRLRAVKLFVSMADNLVPPMAACADVSSSDDDEAVSSSDDEAAPQPATPSTLTLPSTPVTSGSRVADPVGDIIQALGLPSLADRSQLAALLLTYYLPNTAVGVRSYLESQLRLNAIQSPLVAKWVQANPTLSHETWDALAKDARGFHGLPTELEAWFPIDVPFRTRIALAMTQDNDMELMAALVPAMGTLMARRVRAARTDIRANFPDLGAWLAELVCA